MKDKIGDGSIVSLFNATPEPTTEESIFCPHFYELKYANGCGFDCQWCFLNGTFRFDKAVGKSPRRKDNDKIAKDFEKALKLFDTPTIFNAGEVNDGLVFEDQLSTIIFPLLRKYKNKGHRVLILTKSNSMKLTRFSDMKDQVIMAYSVNAPGVSSRWELGAPMPLNRLEAARAFLDLGFEVRLRIDPIVAIEDWQNHYRTLVQAIMKFTPGISVITLGSLRGLQSTLINCRERGNDTTWTEYLEEKSEWGLRAKFEKRKESYEFIIKLLKDYGYRGEIGICKESISMFKAMKLNPFRQVCNCIGNSPLTPLGEKEADSKWESLVNPQTPYNLVEEPNHDSETKGKDSIIPSASERLSEVRNSKGPRKDETRTEEAQGTGQANQVPNGESPEDKGPGRGNAQSPKRKYKRRSVLR